MFNKFAILLLILTSSAVCFILGQYSVTSGKNQNPTQAEIRTAVQVLAKKAEIAGQQADASRNREEKMGKQSDIVVYRNAYNLLRRDLPQSLVTQLDTFFAETTSIRIQNDGRFLYCSTIDSFPWEGIGIGPKHREAEDFFKLVRFKLEQENIGFNELSLFLDKLKVKDLIITPGTPKKNYLVIEQKELNIQQNNIILQQKTSVTNP